MAAQGDAPDVGDEVVEARFREAWRMVKAGRHDSAARAFAEVERMAGERAIAEDAAYWAAISADRAKDPGAAAALARFVQRYPGALRWGEVALLLAARHAADGQRDEARALATRAARDRDPTTRARAEELLRTLR